MIYSRDVTSLPGLAYQIVSQKFDVVTQPVDVLSLQNLVLYARENGIPIVPRGNGTSGWGGAIPTRGGVCVSLSGMSEILYFNELESAVTVETGITWRDLLSFLERLGYTLPVYPSSATAASVGGFVASGGLGIGSTYYGDILKQVIGIEAVLPNGKIIRLGKVLLNSKDDRIEERVEEGNSWLKDKLKAAGFSLPEQETRLLTGTYGTLGIITKVTLKTIPNLQLIPFACSFENMETLVKAANRIVSNVKPYYLRFLTDNYTSKLKAINDYENESGKYILTGALLGTIYKNEESIDSINIITDKEHGILLDSERSWFYWNERLYPWRIKRYGPSLVPAEMLAPVRMLPEILEKTKKELRNSKVAIEGTFSNDGKSSFMVWILDDERKTIPFTVGWYRSFQIASLAERFGGLPYAVGLWNERHASEYYGDASFNYLKSMKKILDPKHLMNPVKVFGGRVTIGRESMFFGFLLGFLVASIGGWFVSNILGMEWISQFLNTNIFQLYYLPILTLMGLFGGLLGLLIVRYMRLNQALAIGIPVLKLLSKIIRR